MKVDHRRLFTGLRAVVIDALPPSDARPAARDETSAVIQALEGVGISVVVVLEARGHLGGRSTSFLHRESGERVDNGQHVLLGCYHETRAFLRRVGAEGLVDFQPRLAVTSVDRQGLVSTLACPIS